MTNYYQKSSQEPDHPLIAPPSNFAIDIFENLIDDDIQQLTPNNELYTFEIYSSTDSNIHDFDFNVPSPDDIVFDARNQKGVVFDVDKKVNNVVQNKLFIITTITININIKISIFSLTMFTNRESKHFSLDALESKLKKRNRISKDAASSQVLSRVEKELWEKLLPHQKEGVVEMVIREGRALLSDEQGLGKTMQALTLCSYYRANWPVLIVCPKSVLHVWKEEIITWLKIPETQIEINDGRKLKNKKSNRVNFVICGYERFSKESGLLAKNYKFDIVIADEAHNIKDPTTLKARALIPMIKQAKHSILITGTPIPNRPIEIFSLLNSLDPVIFSNEMEFALRYCGAFMDNFKRWIKTGATNLDELNAVLRKTVLIRRLKSDVCSDLPPKERETVFCDIKPDLKDKITLLLENSKDSFDKACNSLNQNDSEKNTKKSRDKLSEIYSLTGYAKSPFIVNYVKDLYENTDKKFIIFAYHKMVLDDIEDCIKTYNSKSYIRIDGDTKSNDRRMFCNRFQANDETRVALLSIMAANTGITLTAADIVLFAELTWDPTALFQGEDRAHRIGRKDKVFIKYMIAKDTIDDLMWGVITKKTSTTENILDKYNNQLYIDEFSCDQPALTDQQDTNNNNVVPEASSPHVAIINVDDISSTLSSNQNELNIIQKESDQINNSQELLLPSFTSATNYYSTLGVNNNEDLIMTQNQTLQNDHLHNNNFQQSSSTPATTTCQQDHVKENTSESSLLLSSLKHWDKKSQESVPLTTSQVINFGDNYVSYADNSQKQKTRLDIKGCNKPDVSSSCKKLSKDDLLELQESCFGFDAIEFVQSKKIVTSNQSEFIINDRKRNFNYDEEEEWLVSPKKFREGS
ncbi:12665_t:CDS:2 [Entrophospora sp. SA101]|nr:12665_t:CDS:2 [Entrophospora sp. SA101]